MRRWGRGVPNSRARESSAPNHLVVPPATLAGRPDRDLGWGREDEEGACSSGASLQAKAAAWPPPPAEWSGPGSD